MTQLCNISSEETYDDIVFMGGFNCDTGRGRFFKEFPDFTDDHSTCMADINELPAISYTCISPNASAATS